MTGICETKGCLGYIGNIESMTGAMPRNGGFGLALASAMGELCQ
jgi:hypothetical protein